MKLSAKFFGLFLLLISEYVYAQQYRYSQIPILTINDFRDPPKHVGLKDAVAYTQCYISYNVKQKKRITEDKFFIKYTTNVFLRRDISWLNKKLLLKDKDRLNEVLEHERGHLIIAYLTANELGRRLNRTYSNNYSTEAKEIANRVFSEFKVFEMNYDRETKHSNDQIKQKEWNIKLKKMLPN